MSLMPAWVQSLAGYMPFQWTFFFPIESLIGNMSPNQLIGGLAMQGLWIAIGVILVNLVWKAGVRRYSAVGN
jgi:ABC-2 type transport system permease protein